MFFRNLYHNNLWIIEIHVEPIYKIHTRQRPYNALQGRPNIVRIPHQPYKERVTANAYATH